MPSVHLKDETFTLNVEGNGFAHYNEILIYPNIIQKPCLLSCYFLFKSLTENIKNIKL